MIVRGTLGATAVGNFDALPPELRFFAGGDRSIRGYELRDDRSARGPDGLVLGGDDLAVASAEYEYYFTHELGHRHVRRCRGCVHRLQQFPARILGTGVGVRWRSPVGMVRADLGVPVRDPDGENGIVLHLVIGPDL